MAAGSYGRAAQVQSRLSVLRRAKAAEEAAAAPKAEAEAVPDTATMEELDQAVDDVRAQIIALRRAGDHEAADKLQPQLSQAVARLIAKGDAEGAFPDVSARAKRAKAPKKRVDEGPPTLDLGERHLTGGEQLQQRAAGDQQVADDLGADTGDFDPEDVIDDDADGFVAPDVAVVQADSLPFRIGGRSDLTVSNLSDIHEAVLDDGFLPGIDRMQATLGGQTDAKPAMHAMESDLAVLSGYARDSGAYGAGDGSAGVALERDALRAFRNMQAAPPQGWAARHPAAVKAFQRYASWLHRRAKEMDGVQGEFNAETALRWIQSFRQRGRESMLINPHAQANAAGPATGRTVSVDRIRADEPEDFGTTAGDMALMQQRPERMYGPQAEASLVRHIEGYDAAASRSMPVDVWFGRIDTLDDFRALHEAVAEQRPVPASPELRSGLEVNAERNALLDETARLTEEREAMRLASQGRRRSTAEKTALDDNALALQKARARDKELVAEQKRTEGAVDAERAAREGAAEDLGRLLRSYGVDRKRNLGGLALGLRWGHGIREDVDPRIAIQTMEAMAGTIQRTAAAARMNGAPATARADLLRALHKQNAYVQWLYRRDKEAEASLRRAGLDMAETEDPIRRRLHSDETHLAVGRQPDRAGAVLDAVRPNLTVSDLVRLAGRWRDRSEYAWGAGRAMGLHKAFRKPHRDARRRNAVEPGDAGAQPDRERHVPDLEHRRGVPGPARDPWRLGAGARAGGLAGGVSSGRSGRRAGWPTGNLKFQLRGGADPTDPSRASSARRPATPRTSWRPSARPTCTRSSSRRTASTSTPAPSARAFRRCGWSAPARGRGGGSPPCGR